MCLTGSVGNELGVKIKNHTSKIICSKSGFYRLVWNVEVCSIYSCWLEPLTSMRECKWTVLSWRCFLTLHRSCPSVDIPACWNSLTWRWAITLEQSNIFAAHITLGTAATCQKLSYPHFDVHVALIQYLAQTLFVDFQCSDLKESHIVCLHIQNIVMIIFQT